MIDQSIEPYGLKAIGYLFVLVWGCCGRDHMVVVSLNPIVSSFHQNDFSLMVQSIMKIIFKYHNLLPLICVQVETTHTYNSNS
jgi:hypothetical protein